MDIEIRYFDDCPNWKIADDRVATALHQVGIANTPVTYRHVSSIDQANAIKFQGSPTIVINGVDPFATPGDPIGLACRMFRTEHGLEGSPSVAQIRRALTHSLDASQGPPTTTS